ncbi:MAG: hypothetical protein AABX82_00610 [Nanoarchaeota archaeon]
MGLIDVKYIMSEDLTPEEREELQIRSETGLIAIETSNPTLNVKGVEVIDYVENLLNLSD